jgi:hypothetical protein
MSQNSLGTVPDPTTGATLVALLLAWQDAVHSLHCGAARPSYAQKGTAWLREVSGTEWRLMIYDGTDTDIQIGTLNPVANTWTPTIGGSSILAAMLAPNIVDGSKFVRGATPGHVWTAAGPLTDPGWAAPASSSDRVAKAGDTMTGDLTMSTSGSRKIKASGTTAAVTGLQLSTGADIGGLFVRGVSFSTSGGGVYLSGIASHAIIDGILTVVFNTAGGGTEGGGG